MDFGDLEEYGFDVKGVCGGKACLHSESIKNFDDALSKGTRFQKKALEEMAKLYERAQCHPTFRKNVTPMVETIFTCYPLLCCTWPFAICELPYTLCCWCIEIPWLVLCQWPWNITCIGLTLAGLAIIVASPFIIIGLLILVVLAGLATVLLASSGCVLCLCSGLFVLAPWLFILPTWFAVFAVVMTVLVVEGLLILGFNCIWFPGGFI